MSFATTHNIYTTKLTFSCITKSLILSPIYIAPQTIAAHDIHISSSDLGPNESDVRNRQNIEVT